MQAAATEVTVSDQVATVITTESPAISNTLTSRQILELPTNLRSVYNNSGDSALIFVMMPLLVPGVVQVGSGATWTTPGSGVNGIRLRVDGVDTTFGNFGSPDPVSQPSFESIEEIHREHPDHKSRVRRAGADYVGDTRRHERLPWKPVLVRAE